MCKCTSYRLLQPCSFSDTTKHLRRPTPADGDKLALTLSQEDYRT